MSSHQTLKSDLMNVRTPLTFLEALLMIMMRVTHHVSQPQRAAHFLQAPTNLHQEILIDQSLSAVYPVDKRILLVLEGFDAHVQWTA